MYQRLLHIAVLTVVSPLLYAESVTVAVASNFATTSNALAADFQSRTGHEAVLTFASSGKLYAQIKQGAPFDVFLSADQAKPQLLANETEKQPFTYAIGRLVLWSLDEGLVSDGLPDHTQYNKLALANPRFAPYGVAAEEVLAALGQTSRSKWVLGENINQALQFAASGAADLGFIGYAQWLKVNDRGSHWLIPAELHKPIRQDALLLDPSNTSAVAFVAYLQSEAALKIMHRDGYLAPIELP